jgi:hypothetical protein
MTGQASCARNVVALQCGAKKCFTVLGNEPRNLTLIQEISAGSGQYFSHQPALHNSEAADEQEE